MKKSIVLTALVLMTSVSSAAKKEITFESVRREFRQKVLSLVSAEDVSAMDLRTKIGKFAKETFGAHPGLVRNEAEKRFKALPQFRAVKLDSYTEHKSWNKLTLPGRENGWFLLLAGWDPEKLAGWGKAMVLSRHLGPEAYGRRALLNSCCPDKVYRHGKGKFPDLVVDSLGDLFVIKVEMTVFGVCRPVSLKWMKKTPEQKNAPDKK
jgi:hypothetical protein